MLAQTEYPENQAIHGATDGKARRRERAIPAFGALLVLIALGFVAVFFFARQATQEVGATMSVALLVAGASLIVGGLLGFLFGIPRTHRPDEQEAQASDTRRAAVGVQYRGNTNLEDVSDWLTKILVGVGLIQLTSIAGRLQEGMELFRVPLGNADASGLFGVTIIIYFATCGFLLGFLWTRIYLPQAYRWSDELVALAEHVGALGQQVSRNAAQVGELSDQVQRDARALELVRRQLNATTDAEEIDQNELNEAIGAASANTQTLALSLARTIRKEHSQATGDKKRLGRTIPIFRALAYADTNNDDYRSAAALGYALKDKQPPSWAEAEEELTRAIAIRDRLGIQGWRMYEFNRAICRISQDPGFNSDPKRPAAPEIREAILADLHCAATEAFVYEKILGEDAGYGTAVSEWLALNKVDVSRLDEEA